MKKTNSQKGITLVALIITIIILLILAVVTINAVRGDGIIQYAESARDKYTYQSEKEGAGLIVLEEKLNAQLQGKDIDLGEIDKKLKDAGFKEDKGKYVSKSGVFVFEISEKGEIIECKSYEDENYTPIILESGAIIPEEATYYVQASYYTPITDSFFGTINYGPGVGDYKGATEILKSGEKMPDTPLAGDVFVYGDYEYRYKWNYNVGATGSGEEWTEVGGSGWGVRVLNDQKTEYGQLCEIINGQNVKYLTKTFANTKITKSPILPAGIVDMKWAFENTPITEAPVIPSGVTNMYHTFSKTSITEAPVIPNGVTNMSGTFSNSSIKIAPIIPSSVTDMYYTFFKCTSLEGEIEINAAIESSQTNRYDFCFNQTVKPIILRGTSPILQQLANTATNNNVSVK